MIEQHNIKWYLENPLRLVQMKPFTRGGTMGQHSWLNNEVRANETVDTGFVNLNLVPVSQDLFLTEYDPNMHHIILNKSIPHIKVVIDNNELPNGMLNITQTASFQKLVHAAHVRSLTTNPVEITLCTKNADENQTQIMSEVKQEWEVRDVEWHLYNAIKTCKKVGNVGVLFSFDGKDNRYEINTFSYEDGYQIIPNYDEYGREIARTLAYQIDRTTILDTYDREKHYRLISKKEGWEITEQRHGFSRCPLLHKRGKVAWEYGESSIEMWELMTNIGAIAIKRFGTFALVLVGDIDGNSFKRDSNTLVINLSSDTTNGRQDAKTLEFPEPQTLDGYLKTLEEKISLFTSTSFITPKDITATNSGGNGIALAMSNDYAVASQSAIDWRRFVRDMLILHQEGLDLEQKGEKGRFSSVQLAGKIVPWSLETNNTKIVNLGQEAPYLSTKTLLEKFPDSAPDEIERVIAERGALVSREGTNTNASAQTAQNIAINSSNIIRDNE